MAIKKTYYKFRAYYNIVRKDLKGKHPLAWNKKLKMWYHGFLAEKYVLYQFDKFPHQQFLSDYNASMSRWINEPFNELLTNKYIFANIIGKHFRVPETYGFISQGIYYSESIESFEEVLDNEEYFVIKPVDGGGGKGVYVIKKVNSEFILNDKRVLNKKQLLELLKTKDNYLVMEYIQQGAFQKSLNPNSINTMRILTILDPDTNEPIIVQAVQRVGVLKSQPQDNFTKGGISFNIDLESGVLTDGTNHPKTKTHERFSKHPDTNKQIEGLKIPNWESIKKDIYYVTGKLPMLKCIGWDFLMTDTGLVAIEGNHHPDPDVLQGHKPLLSDSRVKKFYKHHNII